MAVAGMVLGILGISVFWWLGVTLGGIWSAGVSTTALVSGQPVEIVAWPVWALGIGVGVGFPVLGVLLGVVGFAKRQSRGVALAGIVTGSVAALLGLGFTVFTALAFNVADAARNGTLGGAALDSEKAEQLDQMQKTLNDPAFQQQIMKAMEEARRQGVADAHSAGAPRAFGTDSTPAEAPPAPGSPTPEAPAAPPESR